MRPHRLSRRKFCVATVAGFASAAMAAQLTSAIDGVRVGLQTYSLRGIRYPELVDAVRQTGIGEVERFSMQVEPTAAEVPDLQEWRDTVPLDYYGAIVRAGLASWSPQSAARSIRVSR